MFPFSVAPSTTAESAATPAETGSLFARAPKLKECSERAVASIVKNLQTLAGPATTIEGMMAGFSSSTVRAVLRGHREDSVIGSIVVKDLSCMILVMLDGTLVHAMVELLCGGNGVETQAAEPRPATAIDQQFAQIMFTQTAAAIQTDWAEFGFDSARAAKIEGMLSPDIFGARVEDVSVIDFTIGIFGLHGTLRLVLPPAARDRFTADAENGQADGTDPLWMAQLQQEVGRAEVALSAYLDAKDIPLGALAALKIGQILPLPADARSRASLVSDGTVLYRGEIGRDDTHYSVRVSELVSEPTHMARVVPRRSSK
jgi:flagellar motor switch protein FliM